MRGAGSKWEGGKEGSGRAGRQRVPRGRAGKELGVQSDQIDGPWSARAASLFHSCARSLSVSQLLRDGKQLPLIVSVIADVKWHSRGQGGGAGALG